MRYIIESRRFPNPHTTTFNDFYRSFHTFLGPFFEAVQSWPPPCPFEWKLVRFIGLQVVLC